MGKLAVAMLLLFLAGCSGGGQSNVAPAANIAGPANSHAGGQTPSKANDSGERPGANEEQPRKPVEKVIPEGPPLPADPTTVEQRRSELDLIAEDLIVYAKHILDSRDRLASWSNFAIPPALEKGTYYESSGLYLNDKKTKQWLYVPIWNMDDPCYYLTLFPDWSYKIEEAPRLERYVADTLLRHFNNNLEVVKAYFAMAEVRSAIRTEFARQGKPPAFSDVKALREISIPAPYSMPDNCEPVGDRARLVFTSSDPELPDISITFEWASGESTVEAGSSSFNTQFRPDMLCRAYVDNLAARESAERDSRESIQASLAKIVGYYQREYEIRRVWPKGVTAVTGRGDWSANYTFRTSKHRISIRAIDPETGKPGFLIQEYGSKARCMVPYDPDNPEESLKFEWTE